MFLGVTIIEKVHSHIVFFHHLLKNTSVDGLVSEF